MRSRRALWPVLVLVALAGCVSRPAVLLDATTSRDVLTALQAFTFEGRAAATRGSTGSQASLSWEQGGAESRLRLSGPLGMGATRLLMRDGLLEITGSRGEQLRGEAALDALEAQVGMQPPFAALRYWVLGLPAPDSPAQQTLDEAGRLAALAQEGWAVTFDEYRPQVSPQGQLMMPRRLTASRDDLRLRLVIDRWDLSP